MTAWLLPLLLAFLLSLLEVDSLKPHNKKQQLNRQQFQEPSVPTSDNNGFHTQSSSSALRLRRDDDSDDEPMKGKVFKVITPDDISALFDSIPTVSATEEEDEEDVYEEDEDEEEEEAEEEEEEAVVIKKQDVVVASVVAQSMPIVEEEVVTEAASSYSSPSLEASAGPLFDITLETALDGGVSLVRREISSTAAPISDRDAEKQAMFEMKKMEQGMFTTAKVTAEREYDEGNEEKQSRATTTTLTPTEAEVEVEEEEKNEYDDDMGFLDLNRKLEPRQIKRTREFMTVKDAPDRTVPTTERVFRYDPAKTNSRPDPMMYGAYRRWKVPEMEETTTDKNGRKIRKKNGSSSSSGSSTKDEKKGDGGFTTDNFYKAIKNIGPDRKGTGGQDKGGTTFDEPKDMSPITPKKAPTKKNKRKTVTPQDIDSLFPNYKTPDLSEQVKREKEEEEAEDDEDEDEDDDEKGSTGMISSISAGLNNRALTANDYDSSFSKNEEIPQWLTDATAEEKERRKGLKKKSKKKKLTNDWRFWAAIIAAVGFTSAFFNMYQATGGFGGGGPADAMGGGVPGIVGGGGELII